MSTPSVGELGCTHTETVVEEAANIIDPFRSQDHQFARGENQACDQFVGSHQTLDLFRVSAGVNLVSQ